MNHVFFIWICFFLNHRRRDCTLLSIPVKHHKTGQGVMDVQGVWGRWTGRTWSRRAKDPWEGHTTQDRRKTRQNNIRFKRLHTRVPEIKSKERHKGVLLQRAAVLLLDSGVSPHTCTLQSPSLPPRGWYPALNGCR